MESQSEMRNMRRECFLHRSRAICLLGVALSIYVFISGVVKLGEPVSSPMHRDPLFILGAVIGVWLLGTLAQHCNQLLERLFYIAWFVYFVIVGARAVLPLSGSAVRASDFLQATLGLVGIVLSGAIAFWHFGIRTGNAGTDEKFPNSDGRGGTALD